MPLKARPCRPVGPDSLCGGAFHERPEGRGRGIVVCRDRLPVSAQPAAHALNLGRDEQGAIAALQAAAAGPDRAAQDAALAAARAAARSADARYAVAHFQLEIGRARGDRQMFTPAVDALVDSGLSPPDELASLLANQASRAYSGGDMAADRAAARPDRRSRSPTMPRRSPITASSNRASTAARPRPRTGPWRSSCSAARSPPTRPPAAPRARACTAAPLAVAFDGTRPPLGLTQLAPQAIGFARALVAAYPSQVNWRDALLVYRDLAAADPALDLDIRRLQRATQSLAGERDYLDFAQMLDRAGFPGEANAAFDEGVSRGMLDTAKPAIAQAAAAINRRVAADRPALARLHAQGSAAGATAQQARAAADAHFAYGQYAEAAAL